MLYLHETPPQVYCILSTSQVNGALTDLLLCIGRISSSSSDGLDVHVQANRSDSLLPQEYEME